MLMQVTISVWHPEQQPLPLMVMIQLPEPEFGLRFQALLVQPLQITPYIIQRLLVLPTVITNLNGPFQVAGVLLRWTRF